MSGFIFLLYFTLVMYLYYRQSGQDLISLRDCVYRSASVLFYLFLFGLVIFDALHYFGIVPALHLVFERK